MDHRSDLVKRCHGDQPAQGSVATLADSHPWRPPEGQDRDLGEGTGHRRVAAPVRPTDLAGHAHGGSGPSTRGSATSTPPSRRVCLLLGPGLLRITGISHTPAAVLIAEIGDITRFSNSAEVARTPVAPRFPLLLRRGASPAPPRRDSSTQRRLLHRRHRAERWARPPSNCWPIMSRPRAPACSSHPFNGTESTSSTGLCTPTGRHGCTKSPSANRRLDKEA
jgi:hypothetical protein